MFLSDTTCVVTANDMAGLFDNLELPAAADFHVHLRDGAMMAAVTPTVRQGGVDTVFVMVYKLHLTPSRS